MQQFVTALIKEEVNLNKQITTIFNTYYKKIYNYISYRVNDKYAVEDLVSQVFEKVIKNADKYSGDKAPFEVWLFTIAKNIVNDYFRKTKRSKLYFTNIFSYFVGKEKSPEKVVLNKESNTNLAKALEVLSLRERNIIALKFGADLKNTQIAQTLNITESNVGVIVFRALKKLKRNLNEEELM